MAAQKIKRTKPSTRTADDQNDTSPAVTASHTHPARFTASTKKRLIFILFIIALLAFGLWKKNWFVVAVVNGQPITRLELTQALTTQYGQQTLDNLISEKLVEQAISQKGIRITSNQTDQKIADITSSLPKGMTLDQALTSQGMDITTFRHQVQLQLGIDQLLASQTAVSEKEIDDYLVSNSAQFKDSSPSAARAAAKNALAQQKSTTAFQNWFAALRQNAKILNFL